MTTYKEIRGTNIEVVSSDPSNPVLGQVWYNSTDNVVKGFYSNPGSWATGGDLNQGRNSLGGAGTQTAALAFGGFVPPSSAKTEAYNGTNWTEVNDLNTARQLFGAAGATNTAALAFGGSPSTKTVTETWNGTNWTEVNDLNTAIKSLAGAGTNTAALAFGGENPGAGGFTVDTELCNVIVTGKPTRRK